MHLNPTDKHLLGSVDCAVQENGSVGSYPGNWSKDAALGGLIPVEKGTRD